MPATPVLAAEDLSKRFVAINALDHVNFELAAGEVHALVGENGAGKSTLIKVFGGIHRPDAGRVLVDGAEVELHSPADAYAKGIALIGQELRVVPALSVAENVMLGHLPTRPLVPGIAASAALRLDRARMRAAAGAALAQLNLTVDLDQRVDRLTFAERQSVAIARALSRNARVLVLDEPTAALEEREVHSLFAVIEALKAAGVAILYVSHRLDEIVAIADRCTVMRDGRVAADLARGAFSAAELARHMTGRDIEREHAHGAAAPGETLLEADLGGEVRLRAHEVVGLAGLLGSGTSELLRRLFGAAGGARLRVRGRALDTRHPAESIAAGIGMVPNERILGLVLDQTVRDNIVLPNLGRFGTWWRMDDAAAGRVVRELLVALDVRPPDPDAVVRRLSGGNQQKVILAKWLAARIEVLLLDEPTQGIDVAAKAQIHRLMREFAGRGGAVLFASSELDEVLGQSDAVLAMRRQAISARVARGAGLTEHAVREAITFHR
ncbi:MAG: sugar ABC transporter ATP-binding protein [Burkholderiales bacterium]|nr:sugar ABC transporter ATP-binding protein [Burkholderiales bacterium]